MPPLIRNVVIRLVALFEQVIRALVGGLKGISAALGRLFGLAAPGYYVEQDAAARDTQSSDPQQAGSTRLGSSSEPTAVRSAAPSRPLRRSSQTEMDYFRNMARQIKTPGS